MVSAGGQEGVSDGKPQHMDQQDEKPESDQAQTTETTQAQRSNAEGEQQHGKEVPTGDGEVAEKPKEDPSQQVVKLIATNQAASFADYFQ